MKNISVKIEEDQIEKLQTIAKSYKIRGISSLVRRGIDLLIDLEERRAKYEHDKYQ